MNYTEFFAGIVSAIPLALITTFVGTYFLTRKTHRGLSEDILQRQLDEVYSPLVKDYRFTHNTNQKKWVESVYQNFQKNFDLIPSEIFEACQNMRNTSKNIDTKKLFDMVDTNYNWCKKCLKYPYQGDKIQEKYLPNIFREGVKALWITIGICWLFLSIWYCFIVPLEGFSKMQTTFSFAIVALIGGGVIHGLILFLKWIGSILNCIKKALYRGMHKT